MSHAPRVERLQLDGRTVWRKRYSAQGRGLRMALLRWVARRIGSVALLPPAPLDADAACATERGMIERLHALGARVPEIIDAGSRELVLSDIGPTLAATCRTTQSADEREALLAAGFAALSDVHARGGYLAQAFSRNLTILDGRVGFIDLEQDPATIMPIAAAQARDTLFYVYSTARFLADDPTCYQRLLAAHLADAPADARAELSRTVLGLRWLVRCVAPFGRHARPLTLPMGHLLQAVRATSPYVDVRTT